MSVGVNDRDASSMLETMRKLFFFALPISASMLVQMLTTFFSMFMVARLGEKELAAGALASTTYMTASMVCLVFYAVGILISHSRGQENPPTEIGEIVRNGFWAALMIMLPLGFLLWHCDSLLLLFHQDPNLVALTIPYFHFAAFGLPIVLPGMVIFQFFIGIGRPRISLFISLFTMPVCLGLTYLFVFGKAGFPQLGLGGVTASLLIMQIGVCISLFLFVHFYKEFQRYEIFHGKLFQPNKIIIRKIFNLGSPIGIQFGAELGAMSLATYFMGLCGSEALAASQVASQYSLLVVMVILGISQSLTMLSSQAYGQKNYRLIQQYIWSAIGILSLALLTITVLFLFFQHRMLVFFSGAVIAENQHLIHMAMIFLFLSLFVLYVDGLRNILSGALRGLQDAKMPMVIGVTCLWLISVPLSYLAAFPMGGGPIGLRLGFSLGFILSVILLIKRIQKMVKIPMLTV